MTVTNRRHLEVMMAAERIRQNLLFAICLGIAAYIFREMERRQALRERDEAERRSYEDQEFADARETALGHRERAASFKRFAQVGLAVATLFATLAIAYTALLAAHVI